MYKYFGYFIFFLYFIIPVTTGATENILPNVEQERQAMRIFSQVKCIVCNGQSIKDSGTISAQAMREHVRNLVQQNKSDKEVIEIIIATYGQDVLFDNNKSFFIYLLPFFIIIMALSIVYFINYYK